MTKIHTHYDNLKVARDAPVSVIKAAYKALSQTYHPDKFQGSSLEAERIMKIINTAYNELINEDKRLEHDNWIYEQEKKPDQKESSQKQKETVIKDESYYKQELKKFGCEISIKTSFFSRTKKWHLTTKYDEVFDLELLTEFEPVLSFFKKRAKEESEINSSIQVLKSLDCTISSTGKGTKKKWRILTKHGELYINIHKLDEFKGIVGHCNQVIDCQNKLDQQGFVLNYYNDKWSIINQVGHETKFDSFSKLEIFMFG